MASKTLLNDIIKELSIVLDLSQVAIYIDVNSGRNLPILKNYLKSALVPITTISHLTGKAGDKSSINEQESIENQCHELFERIINHIRYIKYCPKTKKVSIIIDKVAQKILKKLKYYLEVSKALCFFDDHDQDCIS